MTLIPLRSYEGLHPSEQQAADEVWNLYKTHEPDLYAKLAWNDERFTHPYHCGFEVGDDDGYDPGYDDGGHLHNHFCSKHPQAVSEELKRLDAERAPRPFQGHWHDTDSLDNLPPLVPLLDGIFYRKTLSRIVGHSASMKSFVVLDMARAMGWGEDWNGVRTQQKGIRTLIVVAEGAEGIRARKLALEQFHGRKLENIFFITRAIQIDAETRDWQQLTTAVNDNGIDLVVFDTQSRCSVGLEENSNKEMAQVVATLDKLIASTGVAVCLVHHSTGDQSSGGPLKGRGAGAVRAALQGEIFVQRNRNLNTVTVTTDKAKDSASQKIVLEPLIREVDGLSDYWGDLQTSVVLVSAAPRIKGAVGGGPADAETAVETVETLAARFTAKEPPLSPTVANVRRVLGIAQGRAQEVSRHIRTGAAAA